MLLLALTATTLVSCNDDSDIATTLEGTWQGDMEVRTYYDGQYYQAVSSEICFVQDPYAYSSGTGIGSTITGTLHGATIRWPTISSGRCLTALSTCTLSKKAHLWRFATIVCLMAISKVPSTMTTRLSTSVSARCPHPTGTVIPIGATTTMTTITMAVMPRRMLPALALRLIARQSR